MGKVVLDTDVFVEIFNQNNQIFEFISDIILFENIITTSITEAELIISANNKETQKKIEQYLSDVEIINLNRNADKVFSLLIKKYHLSHNIKIADCLIASICLTHDFTLFTLNTKDFQFLPNLKLISHNIKPIKIPFK